MRDARGRARRRTVTPMWSLDRRVAAAAVVISAFALAIPIAVADAPAPTGAGGPVAAVRELVALANRGAAQTWLVTYAFTRTTDTAGQLHDTIVEAHGPSLDVDDGLGSLVVTTQRRTYSCTVVGATPQCLARPVAGDTAHPGDVYGGAVVSGRYTIARAPAATIAGLDAACFILRLIRGSPIPGLGFSSEQCYSRDGVPLLSRVQTSAAVDERSALTVRRTVGRAELLSVLQPYGLARLLPDR